jgi:hypothetical protein
VQTKRTEKYNVYQLGLATCLELLYEFISLAQRACAIEYASRMIVLQFEFQESSYRNATHLTAQ